MIIDEVNAHIKQIQADNIEQHESILSQAIEILTTGLPKKSKGKNQQLAKTGIQKNITALKHEDILFFRELMRPIEKRVGYKEGRGDRLAKLALYVVSNSGKSIPQDQLAVACYVHDFGMAFMPNEIVKKQSFSPIESNLLRSHVYKSTRLIEHLEAWDEARKIVMQHHENMDGSGYPLGIKEDEICEGAKLLSILIRYEDLVHGKGQTYFPKAAIVYLNKNYKAELSSFWLHQFNHCMSKLLIEE